MELTDLPCACATARQLARVLTQLYDSRMSPAGVEAPQFALLMALQKQGPCSQKDLGSRYALDKTTVSRNLKQLQKNGWVAGSPGEDRRVREFKLTAEGRRRLTAAKTGWDKAQRELRSAMPGEQWDSMFLTFRSVAETALKLRKKTA